MERLYVLIEPEDGARIRILRVSVFDQDKGWRREEVAPGFYVTNAAKDRLDGEFRWWIVAARGARQAYGAVRAAAKDGVNLYRRKWSPGGRLIAHGGR